MDKQFTFRAEIQAGDGGGAFVIFPRGRQHELGDRGRVPIHATIDGESYRGSLIKYGSPQLMLLILKSIRQKINKGIGDTVDVVVWLDTEERKIELPDDVHQALQAADMVHTYTAMSYSHQREYMLHIADAKKPETRTRRIASMISQLKQKQP
jgi:hypothetical protein